MSQRKRRFEEAVGETLDDDHRPEEEMEAPKKKTRREVFQERRREQQETARRLLAQQEEELKRGSMQDVGAASFSVGRTPNRNATTPSRSRRSSTPASSASKRERRTPSQRRRQPPLAPSLEVAAPPESPGSPDVFEFGTARRKSDGVPAALALGMIAAGPPQRKATPSSRAQVQLRRSVKPEITTPTEAYGSTAGDNAGTAMPQHTVASVSGGRLQRRIAAPGRDVVLSPEECGMRRWSHIRQSSESPAVPFSSQLTRFSPVIQPQSQDQVPKNGVARLDLPRRQSISSLSSIEANTVTRPQLQVSVLPPVPEEPNIIEGRRERSESWSSGPYRPENGAVENPETQHPKNPLRVKLQNLFPKLWLAVFFALLAVTLKDFSPWIETSTGRFSEPQQVTGSRFECPAHAVCEEDVVVSCEPSRIWVLHIPSESKSASGCVLSESAKAKVADVVRLLDKWSWSSACKYRHGIVTPAYFEANNTAWFKYGTVLEALKDQASAPGIVDILSAAELTDAAQALLAMSREQASDDEDSELLVGLLPNHVSAVPLSCRCAGWISGTIELVVSAGASALKWLVMGPLRFVLVVGVSVVLENPVRNGLIPVVVLGVVYVLHALREHRRDEEQLASDVEAANEHAINILKLEQKSILCSALIETLADSHQDRSRFKNRVGPRVLDRLERDHRIKLIVVNNQKCMLWDGPVRSAS